MQVFSNKTFKRIFALVSLMVLLVLVYVVVTKQLENVTYATYFNAELEEIEKNKESVDLVFVGSSRLYHSMVPSILEEKLGYDNVLVAATATQPICGTYYYLKDLVERVKPQKVIINVTFDGLLNENSAQPCLLVYDRLSFKNKISFVFECMDPSDRKYILGPSRYRDNILVYEEVKEERDKVNAQSENTYDPVEDYYAEKGFIYSYSDYETGTIPFEYGVRYQFAEENIKEKNLEYLDKCIKLCKDNNIEVSLVTAPCSLAYMYYVEGYGEANDWFRNYAKDQGISYINLNYLKNREELLPDELMYDQTHTNGEGAKIISEIYAEILAKQEQGEDISAYFYEDFEALKADVHRILAVSTKLEYTSKNDGKNIVTIISLESLHNESVVPQYRVEFIDKEGAESVLVDWTTESEMEVLLPMEPGYSIRVRARSGIEKDAEAYQLYTY